jgi:hypothetical protein
VAPTSFEDLQQPAGPRYTIRGELDGLWTVYDVITDAPAVCEEQMLVYLTFDLAGVMLEHLIGELDASRGPRGPWRARYVVDE